MTVVDDVVIRLRTLGGGAAAGELGAAESGIRRVGGAAKQIAGAAGLAALAFSIKDVTQAAIGFQQQQSQIANALHQTGQYSRGAVEQLSGFADSLSTHGGYDPTQTLSGVNRLIRAHDSVAQAMKDERLATDIARAGLIPYNTAVRTVSIVEQGRTTGLGRLGVVTTAVNAAEQKLKDTHQHQVDVMKELEAHGVKFTAVQRLQYEQTHRLTAAELAHAKAQDAGATKTAVLTLLWHRFGGATEAYSHSAAGAISNFTHQADVLAQSLGKLLLPLITLLAQGMTAVAQVAEDVVKWFAADHDKVIALGIAIGLVAAAYGIYKVATVEAIVETELFRLAMLSLQTVGIVLLIAAIATAIYLLIKHWKDVKAAALDAWHWIEQAGQDVWNWLKENWPLVLSILTGPIGAAVIWIVRHWSTVTGVFHDIWDWLKGAWQTLEGVIKAPFTAAFAAIEWVYDHTIKPIIDAINTVLGNDTRPLGHSLAAGAARSHARGQVFGPSGGGHPGRQSGGPVYHSGVYRVGEMGPELVYLPTGSDVVGGGGGNQGVPLQNHISIRIGPREFARAMVYSQASQRAAT